jgi:RsiW-degrading membrane proteinase PrsW (M82 family)
MWLYLIGVVIVGVIGLYFIGKADVDQDESIGMGFTAILVSALWPLILTLVVIALPFVGAFMLGKRNSRKKDSTIE